MGRTNIRRPPPVVVVAAVAFLMFVVSHRTPPLAVAAALRYGLAVMVAVAGAVVAMMAVREFQRAQTTVNPLDLNRTQVLVTTGVFRFSRNPMYIAMLLLLLSFGCLLA